MEFLVEFEVEASPPAPLTRRWGAAPARPRSAAAAKLAEDGQPRPALGDGPPRRRRKQPQSGLYRAGQRGPRLDGLLAALPLARLACVSRSRRSRRTPTIRRRPSR